MSEEPCAELPPDCRIGRRENSASRAKRAPKRRAGCFMLRENEYELSVDRLDMATEREMVAVVRRTSPVGYSFRGWYVLTAAVVRELGLTVIASPADEPPNPYHAHIDIPVREISPWEVRRSIVRDYALALALRAPFLTASADAADPVG